MTVLLLLGFMVASCYLVRYDGPYKGKVIDAETGNPLEGGVVLGVWYKEIATASGGVSAYYDADETVTNKNGEFEIKGKGLRILSSIGPMSVLVFKTGYSQIGLAPWESHKYDGGLLENRAKMEGDRVVFPVRKLTMEERKSRLFGKENIPDEKQRLLINEINKERVTLDLPPYEDIK